MARPRSATAILEPELSELLRPGGVIRPEDQQPELPESQFILNEAPDEEAVPMDVIFVGGGPAGLAGELALRLNFCNIVIGKNAKQCFPGYRFISANSGQN